MDNTQIDSVITQCNEEARLWYVYILLCEKDQSLYTGITTDIDKRIAAHNQGKGARYTRSRGPVSLLYCESAMSRSIATKREMALKKLSRQQKWRLINANESA